MAKSANTAQARGIMFWLLGNLSCVRWEDGWLGLPATLLAILACFWHIRALDAFTFGTDSAASLGIAVRRTQIFLIGTAALTTAVMASMVGSIGFVGLVIPHAMRLIVGVRHARLVHASPLAGAVFLLASDFITRPLIPGQVRPIVPLTA